MIPIIIYTIFAISAIVLVLFVFAARKEFLNIDVISIDDAKKTTYHRSSQYGLTFAGAFGGIENYWDLENENDDTIRNAKLLNRLPDSKP